jgi:hypothetical protein
MRQRLVFCLFAAVVLALPVTGAAQHREPHAGSAAVGAGVGVYVPGSEFHAGFTPEGFAEFYVTGRLSLRALGGWTTPSLDDNTGEMRQVRGTFSVIYNWEAELWHPFVVVGGGLYRVQPRAQGENSGPVRTRGGGHVGIGVEYFAQPSVTFKFEATYSVVQQGDLPFNPSGLSLTAGLKKYF